MVILVFTKEEQATGSLQRKIRSQVWRLPMVHSRNARGVIGYFDTGCRQTCSWAFNPCHATPGICPYIFPSEIMIDDLLAASGAGHVCP